MKNPTIPAFVPTEGHAAATQRKARLITRADVLNRVGIGKTALYDWVSNGTFPKPVSIGRASRWVEAEIDSWIDAQIAHRDAA